jgi:hypothetical protein
MLGVFRVRGSQGGGAKADWASFERRQRSEVRAMVARSAKDPALGALRQAMRVEPTAVRAAVSPNTRAFAIPPA